jgi:hypothetical protein
MINYSQPDFFNTPYRMQHGKPPGRGTLGINVSIRVLFLTAYFFMINPAGLECMQMMLDSSAGDQKQAVCNNRGGHYDKETVQSSAVRAGVCGLYNTVYDAVINLFSPDRGA